MVVASGDLSTGYSRYSVCICKQSKTLSCLYAGNLYLNTYEYKFPELPLDFDRCMES